MRCAGMNVAKKNSSDPVVTAERIVAYPRIILTRNFKFKAQIVGGSPASARNLLAGTAGAAASVLLKVMVDSATPASVRVRATECVLDHAAKAIEIEDVETRVADLERAADVSQQGRR